MMLMVESLQEDVGNLRMMMLMIESLLEEVLLVERTRDGEWLDHQEVILMEN